MTTELLKDTKPYLDALSKMGGEFKLAHADKFDAKKEAKLLKRYNKDNPLDANATDQQKAAHAQGAQQKIQDFKDRLPTNIEVHNGTRDLRNDFKGFKEGNYNKAAQDAFEQRYADLCQKAGRTEPSPLEAALPRDSPLRTKLDPLTGGLRDPSSGLYANMVKMGEGAAQKNVLIFGGTGVGAASSAQVQADAGQFMGGVPKAYRQAADLTALVQNNLQPGARLETAGHSLGGGLASYAALKNGGIQATCFNAAALGGGCKASIGGNLGQAKDNVRHINVRGDLVGDGIGPLRQPIQKIADGAYGEGATELAKVIPQIAKDGTGLVGGAVGKVGSFVAHKIDPKYDEHVDRLKTSVGNAKDRLVGAVPEPVKQFAKDAGREIGNVGIIASRVAGQVAKPVGQALGKAVSGAATDIGREVGNAGIIAGQVAKPVGQALGRAATGVAGQVSQQAQRLADNLPEPIKAAGEQIAESATSAKTSVRDALNKAKNTIKENLSSLKENIKGTAQEAGDALKSTSFGQKAHEAAVKLHENLGMSQGKLAIPHQYGGCITLDNGGKENPIGNHLTGALDKAFNRQQQQQQQPQSLRSQVKLGQQRAGGGGGGSMHV